jgi:electron transfer flavoprotein alpha subunit
LNEIVIFSENSSLQGELITAAHDLSKVNEAKVAAAVIGSIENARLAIASGAEKVYWLGELEESRLIDDYLPTFFHLFQQYQPTGMIIGATKRGKAIAGRLAAKVGTSAITDAKRLLTENGKIEVSHMVYGGGAIRVDQPISATFIITIGQGLFESRLINTDQEGEIINVPFVEPEWHVVLRERQKNNLVAVDLASARRIVCPGKGLGKQEDLAMIEELAQLLDAEIGCTRPLTEGVNWLSREHYIGVSGKYIKPELYIGIGVSGQIQHTIGVSDARIIVGINKDQAAPIFEQADYGIVGDLYQIIPALIKAIREEA